MDPLHLLQLDRVDDLSRLPGSLGEALPSHHQGEEDVVVGVEGPQRLGFLWRDCDPSANLSGMTKGVEAEDADGAGRREQLGGGNPQEGCLARPVPSKKSEDLSLGHLQPQLVESRLLRLAVELDKPVRFYDKRWHESLPLGAADGLRAILGGTLEAQNSFEA